MSDSFANLKPAIDILIGVKDIVGYTVTGISACLVTATTLHWIFKKKSASDLEYRNGLENTLDAVKKVVAARDEEIEKLKAELARVSAPQTLTYAKKDLADGNDGSTFDRLSNFLSENSSELAEITNRLARVWLAHGLAIGNTGDLEHSYKLANVARFLQTDEKGYASLCDEIGALLSGRTLVNAETSDIHEVFHWLHLKDPDHVKTMVEALISESFRELTEGRYELGRAAAEAAYRLAEKRLDVSDATFIRSEFRFVESLRLAGYLTLAEESAKTSWNRLKNSLGADSVITARAAFEFAFVLRDRGDLEKAEPIVQSAWCALRNQTEPDIWTYAVRSAALYADVLRGKGKLEEAARLCEPIYADEIKYRPQSTHTLMLGAVFGGILMLQGHTDEAEPILRHTWDIGNVVLPLSPEVLHFGSILAVCLIDQNRVNDAKHLAEAVWTRAKACYPAHHWFISHAQGAFARALCFAGEGARAEPLAREALANLELRLGEDHQTTIEFSAVLAFLLISLGKFAEAEPLARTTWERRDLLPNPSAYLPAGLSYAEALEGLSRRDEALSVAREVLFLSRSRAHSIEPDVKEFLSRLEGGSHAAEI